MEKQPDKQNQQSHESPEPTKKGHSHPNSPPDSTSKISVASESKKVVGGGVLSQINRLEDSIDPLHKKWNNVPKCIPSLFFITVEVLKDVKIYILKVERIGAVAAKNAQLKIDAQDEEIGRIEVKMSKKVNEIRNTMNELHYKQQQNIRDAVNQNKQTIFDDLNMRMISKLGEQQAIIKDQFFSHIKESLEAQFRKITGMFTNKLQNANNYLHIPGLIEGLKSENTKKGEKCQFKTIEEFMSHQKKNQVESNEKFQKSNSYIADLEQQLKRFIEDDDGVKKTFQQRIDGFDDYLTQKFDHLKQLQDSKFKSVKSKIDEQIDTMNDKIDVIEGKQESQEMKQMKNQIQKLSQRIKLIEEQSSSDPEKQEKIFQVKNQSISSLQESVTTKRKLTTQRSITVGLQNLDKDQNSAKYGSLNIGPQEEFSKLDELGIKNMTKSGSRQDYPSQQNKQSSQNPLEIGSVISYKDSSKKQQHSSILDQPSSQLQKSEENDKKEETLQEVNSTIVQQTPLILQTVQSLEQSLKNQQQVHQKVPSRFAKKEKQQQEMIQRFQTMQDQFRNESDKQNETIQELKTELYLQQKKMRDEFVDLREVMRNLKLPGPVARTRPLTAGARYQETESRKTLHELVTSVPLFDVRRRSTVSPDRSNERLKKYQEKPIEYAWPKSSQEELEKVRDLVGMDKISVEQVFKMPKVCDEDLRKTKMTQAQQKAVESKRVLREAMKFRSYVLEFQAKEKADMAKQPSVVKDKFTGPSEVNTSFVQNTQHNTNHSPRTTQERPKSQALSPSNPMSLSNPAIEFVNHGIRLENEKMQVQELARIHAQRKKQARFQNRPQTAKQRPEVRDKSHRPISSPFNNLSTVTRSNNTRNRKLNKSTSNLRIQISNKEMDNKQTRFDHFTEVCQNSLRGQMTTVAAKFEKFH